MRMNRIVTVGVLALSLSLSSVARPRVGETCTSEFPEWHESMAANPPILYGDFGYAFCERNTESISGKNYLDYYGDWYDAHYVAPPPDSRGFDSGPFFDRIESLANLATEGPKALRNYWPGRESLVQSQTHSNSYAGGGAHLVEGISVIESEIRVSRDDASHLVLATMKIDAPCISLETMRARYPSVIMTDAPRTASPDAYAAWSIFGPWGEIAFGFSYANPKCISRVTLIPDAFPPALSL